LRNWGAHCSTIGLCCVTITWQQIFEGAVEVTVVQARRQDLAAVGAKNQKERPKNRREDHNLKIQYWMYAATDAGDASPHQT